MADSHNNCGSVETRSNGLILVESLINLTEQESETTREILNTQRGAVNVRSMSNEILKSIEDIQTDIVATSTEKIKAKLSKDSLSELTTMRKKIVVYCRNTFAEFPKEKPLRRVTRSGGRSANEKLTSDIVALVKSCCSKEATTELNDIFPKSVTQNDCMYFSSQGTIEETGTREVLKLLEKMELKMCKMMRKFKEGMADLKDRAEVLGQIIGTAVDNTNGDFVGVSRKSIKDVINVELRYWIK